MTLDDLLTKIDQQVDYGHVDNCECQTKGNAKTCPDCLHQQYFSGNPVDYTCSQTRLVYVLRFLPVHMQENFSILQGLDASKIELDPGRPVEVLALGGGPGSEIAALRKFIKLNGFFGDPVSDVHVTQLDRVDEWSSIYSDVRQLFEEDKVTFKYLKITGDVTKCADFTGRYDIVFLSYILSELSDAEAKQLANKLFSVVRDKVVLVINDRNQTDVVNRMQTIVNKFNIRSRYAASTEKHFGLSYPDDIRRRAKAKLQMKSYRLGVIATK